MRTRCRGRWHRGWPGTRPTGLTRSPDCGRSRTRAVGPPEPLEPARGKITTTARRLWPGSVPEAATVARLCGRLARKPLWGARGIPTSVAHRSRHADHLPLAPGCRPSVEALETAVVRRSGARGRGRLARCGVHCGRFRAARVAALASAARADPVVPAGDPGPVVAVPAGVLGDRGAPAP